MTRTTDPDVDVLVVGAGAAGLACAADLAAAGLLPAVLEAADRVGGRMATDLVDGFVLDRGFQVFNTAYPQVRARLDLKPLRLRAFTPGFVIVRGGRRLLMADPTRRPEAAAALLRAGVRPVDLAALGLLSARDMLLPTALLKRAADTSTDEALRRAGLSDPFVDGVVAPFLRGVFLERELTTSSRVFHLVWRSMLRGSLCLPEQGIGAVPRQLADGLPPGTVRLRAGVTGILDHGVQLATGERLRARAVVVATGGTAAARLLPGLRTAASRAVTTVYHAAPRAPLDQPVLTVDGDGPLLHTSVVSNLHPGYAPDGQALVSTSLLGLADDERLAAAERRLAELYRTSTRRWERVAAYRIEEALPAMPAPHPLTRTSRIAPGRYVCGDHRGTGSLQGALASGARAAREVLQDLAPDRGDPRRYACRSK
ncbi:NAD(P)/FAD-dependent oxidoreductase [Streptacidiphilus sp. P02-A3a]|uniref:NAD(P)/FAD-dependent oxidoreductase n=1 Tax=Streptacidiphilus sp. P02-A3a TaxID=2704468 RepID=UPI0015FD0323|nr:NAD(P)/FAD-dependent oxidoreductase [Streptacidiphilus sp. P02-A3a]QMU71658.1 FAD-dependent oxidoreductase [Streptacidiphilus sp. P02-A3a]